MMGESEDQAASSDEPPNRRSPDDGMNGEDANERLHCAACGAEVPEGDRSCPVCRRGVYRTCFCGWQLPVSEANCPNCGADWSQSTRVARKSRSRKRRTRDAVRYAVVGALTAVAAALVIHGVLVGFAALAGEERQAAPRGTGERLRLALDGIARLLDQAWAVVVAHGATIILIAGIMALGAAVGTAVYLVQRGRVSDRGSSSRRVRRKRRK